jgi:hypothetical protein
MQKTKIGIRFDENVVLGVVPRIIANIIELADMVEDLFHLRWNEEIVWKVSFSYEAPRENNVVFAKVRLDLCKTGYLPAGVSLNKENISTLISIKHHDDIIVFSPGFCIDGNEEELDVASLAKILAKRFCR